MSGRRITIVASELLGRVGTGGAGTADSLLAVALGRHGHRVRLLVATGREIGDLDRAWSEIYASSGVEIGILGRLDGVRPEFMRPAFEVSSALRDDPPDVVVVNDWRALGSLALRARQVGIALQETAFVVHCHGPARVLAEFARKVPDTAARFGEQVLEQASVELADAVVSPSAWLLGWMRSHGWPLPDAPLVVPYLLESTALGVPPAPAPVPSRVRRLAFFGQLREGKGIRIYLQALRALDPTLLDGLELVFLGRESKRWTRETIWSSLPASVKNGDERVRFETSLDRRAALEVLREPGTLALMPSLLDNSPNTVSECIEHAVPFVATHVGGIPELVAREDRERVLCDPTVGGLTDVLSRTLASRSPLRPAKPARDPAQSLAAWLDLVETVAPPAPGARARPSGGGRVRVVALDDAAARRASRIAERARSVEVEVVRPALWSSAALEDSSVDWLLFLEDGCEPDDDLLDRLVAAQEASGADAVTCAVRTGDSQVGLQLFLGDPGSLGLTANHYGVIGLVRRSLALPNRALDTALDPHWVLFSRLALSGARIVSIPEPLALHRGKPGDVSDVPGDGLAVLEAFERGGGDRLSDLPQLAATLAAAPRRAGIGRRSEPPREPLAQRGLRVLREEGARAMLRRVRARIPRGR